MKIALPLFLISTVASVVFAQSYTYTVVGSTTPELGVDSGYTVDGDPDTKVPVSDCGGYYVMGDEGFLSTTGWATTYEFSEGYTEFEIYITALLIDSWNSETLEVYVNGNIGYTLYHNFINSYYHYCGNDEDYDLYWSFTFYQSFPCKVDELSIMIKTNLDEDGINESLRIQYVQVGAANRCVSGCECCAPYPSNALCTECSQEGEENETCDPDTLPELVIQDDNDAEEWGTESNSDCSGETFIGGYGLLQKGSSIERTFDLGDQYTDLFIVFDVLFVDVQSYLKLDVYVNGENFFKLTPSSANLTCGDESYYDGIYRSKMAGISLDCPVDEITIKFRLGEDEYYYDYGYETYFGIKNVLVYGYDRLGYEKECLIEESEDSTVNLSLGELIALIVFQPLALLGVCMIMMGIFKSKACCNGCKAARDGPGSSPSSHVPNSQVAQGSNRPSYPAIQNNSHLQPASLRNNNQSNDTGINNMQFNLFNRRRASNPEIQHDNLNPDNGFANNIADQRRGSFQPGYQNNAQNFIMAPPMNQMYNGGGGAYGMGYQNNNNNADPFFQDPYNNHYNSANNNNQQPPIGGDDDVPDNHDISGHDDFNGQKQQEIDPATEMKRKNESGIGPLLCIVCMDGKRTCAFFPCMHFSCCEACAKSLQQKKGECPICRKKTTGFTKVYIA